MKKVLMFFSLLLPWILRRRVLESWFGYQIHPKARIGYSWIFPSHLIMESGAMIDHFTVAIHLDLIIMQENSKIGRGNWITGLSTKTPSKHFNHASLRKAELFMGNSSAITKNHHIDCTDKVEIGKYTTIAGYNSQLLTHSIDIEHCRQDCSPISIGEYSFVGTNVVVLGGASLPSYSVLGAKSLLNKSFKETHKLYGGVPAKVISDLPNDYKYFTRTDGFVN